MLLDKQKQQPKLFCCNFSLNRFIINEGWTNVFHTLIQKPYQQLSYEKELISEDTFKQYNISGKTSILPFTYRHGLEKLCTSLYLQPCCKYSDPKVPDRWCQFQIAMQLPRNSSLTTGGSLPVSQNCI